jgi:hypothetical protein
MFKAKTVLAAGLVVVVLAGLLFISSALAQAPPGPRRDRTQQCQGVISQDAVNPILVRHRDRLQTARENMVREERALRALLVADTTTRGALDAQIIKSNETRNAFARSRLDLLWDLRTVIPAQNREQAFRCAELMMRRR